MTNRRLALYDFDGTLTYGDTFWRFIVHCRGWLRFTLGLVVNLPWLIAYKIGIITNHKAKQHMFGCFFKGVDAQLFQRLGESFFNKWGPQLLRKGVAEKIRMQKEQGVKVAIVTASIEGWVRPFQQFLGADLLLATQVEVDKDGCLTGLFSGSNCHGQEKVRRLKEAIPHIDSYYIEAYGDSSGDKPLLALANEPHYKEL